MHHALSSQLGGSAFATLEEVVARLARSKVGWHTSEAPPQHPSGVAAAAATVVGCASRALPLITPSPLPLSPPNHSLPTAPHPPPLAQACKSYATARDGLLVNGRFVLGQFETLDAASGHKALKFMDTDFGRALQQEVGGSAGGCGGGGRQQSDLAAGALEQGGAQRGASNVAGLAANGV